MLSCEESGYVGPYQDSIVSVTQNCVLVSNILGQTCVFLGKGMAKCRQAVRKSCKTYFYLLSNSERSYSKRQVHFKIYHEHTVIIDKKCYFTGIPANTC